MKKWLQRGRSTENADRSTISDRSTFIITEEVSKCRNQIKTIIRYCNEQKSEVEYLKQEKDKKDKIYKSLKQEIESLKQKNKKIEHKLKNATEKLPHELIKKREKIVTKEKNNEGSSFLMAVYTEFIKILATSLENQLMHLLNYQPEKSSNDDVRQKYRVYGLLLSACSLRGNEPPDTKVIAEEVFLKLQQKSTLKIERSIIKGYIERAVNLTHRMLTLLPPLIVTTCPDLQFDPELLHDVHRHTWNEKPSATHNPLIYYRPILLFGNQLQVAFKGSVGNSKEEIKDAVGHEAERDQSSDYQKTYASASAIGKELSHKEAESQLSVEDKDITRKSANIQ
ncbi:PREDICTED: uncharacterized protein LOC109581238 isoform X2 [Amphimedon queenslandica]|uniref:Mitochondria-eating protein C-terminal domain-containing protein n=1 Tax=Amphimedon queenslandica TaxID=400682 RepID=A0AAN0J131_AMPQE|nr:PREDICTED: uncharacterized protein LOC109581238 isoform X2 [Amphimedon queenslandica]|eukprot:XP_019850744.1 PREDICTED: uncharacterized protein LOC109581238 isoform X2 [Amphimedon queenslandica]